MLSSYIEAAMRSAHYEYWQDENTYYGEIPLLEGVLATAPTLEECRDQLKEVLEGWLLVSLRMNLPIPEIDNISLEVKEAA